MRLDLFLRSVFLLLLGGVIIQPAGFWPRKSPPQRQRPMLAVLVDASRSMQAGGPPQTRWQRVHALLSGPIGQELRRSFHLLWYAVAGDAQRLNGPPDPSSKPAGTRTDLAQSLHQARQDAGENLSGILLLSDGRHNGGGDPVEAVRSLHIPINTVIFEEAKSQDVELADVRTSEFAFKNRPLAIALHVRGTGLLGKTVPVLLKRGGQVLNSEKVSFSATSQEVEAHFRWVPRETGTVELQAEVPVQAGETRADNNRITFRVQVIREKTRVLYICGQPGMEYALLRQFLKSDPGIELVSFVILRNPENLNIVPEEQLSLIPFPTQEIFMHRLFEFDVVVFENFSSARFGIPQAYLENLRKFVVEKGGGFLMMGGENSFALGAYRGTPVETLLPVQLESEEPSALGGLFKMQVAKPDHPLLALGDTEKETAETLSSLPELDGANPLGAAKAGAVVLGVRPWGKSSPVVALWSLGQGRVMALASDTTWRWALGQAGQGRGTIAYQRFWKNALGWLSREERKRVWLSANRTRARRGETVRIAVRVLGLDFNPVRDADVRVHLESPTGRAEIVKTHFAGEGRWEGETRLSDAGDTQFMAQASRGGRLLGEDRLRLPVSSWTEEEEDVRPDPALLRALAQVSGGKAFSPDDLMATPPPDNTPLDGGTRPGGGVSQIAHRPVTEKGAPEKIRRSPWHHPILLCVMLGLLTIEWLWRRRHGLP